MVNKADAGIWSADRPSGYCWSVLVDRACLIQSRLVGDVEISDKENFPRKGQKPRRAVRLVCSNVLE